MLLGKRSIPRKLLLMIAKNASVSLNYTLRWIKQNALLDQNCIESLIQRAYGVIKQRNCSARPHGPITKRLMISLHRRKQQENFFLK